MTKRLLAILLTCSLVAPTNAQAIFGVGDTGDGILAGILQQNITQTLQGNAQYLEIISMLTVARQEYDTIRNVYALGSDIANMNPADVLRRSEREFMASNPVVHQAMGLAQDIARNGLAGGDAYAGATYLRREYDIFQQDRRAQECGCDNQGQPYAGARGECYFICSAAHARGYPFGLSAAALAERGYDRLAAARLSAASDTAVYDPRTRDDLFNQQPENATAGVVISAVAQQDPGAAQALLIQRAAAAAAQSDAQKLASAARRAGDRSFAENTALGTQASTLGAIQLAAIREMQAKQVAYSEFTIATKTKDERLMEAQYRLYIQANADANYRRITGKPAPASYSMPSLGDAVFKATEGAFQ